MTSLHGTLAHNVSTATTRGRSRDPASSLKMKSMCSVPRTIGWQAVKTAAVWPMRSAPPETAGGVRWDQWNRNVVEAYWKLDHRRSGVPPRPTVAEPGEARLEPNRQNRRAGSIHTHTHTHINTHAHTNTHRHTHTHTHKHTQNHLEN